LLPLFCASLRHHLPLLAPTAMSPHSHPPPTLTWSFMPASVTFSKATGFVVATFKTFVIVSLLTNFHSLWNSSYILS
jgi:hypothetical protein